VVEIGQHGPNATDALRCPDQPAGTVANVRGYDDQSYGDAFADVYDDWYRSISDVDLTVIELLDLTDAGPVLELGVGTGRLAVPLAEAGLARGVRVTGIDVSQAMLDRLAWRDPGGLVEAIHGDMVDDLPPGPFGLVFVAYNTLFALTDDGAQQRCFTAVAERLRPGARFVVEAFVPEEPPRRGDSVNVRTLEADRVVLSVSVTDPDRQTAEGQFVELSEAGGVRLRPWSIRYATPDQLDGMAAKAGLELEHRWEAFDRSAFHDESPRHVSVYTRGT
jgi:SAM-dependent methyltransferase